VASGRRDVELGVGHALLEQLPRAKRVHRISSVCQDQCGAPDLAHALCRQLLPSEEQAADRRDDGGASLLAEERPHSFGLGAPPVESYRGRRASENASAAVPRVA
jgi:hypothetical protein